MRAARFAFRSALGLALIVHGLGNAVLPLRGVDPAPWIPGVHPMAVISIVAIVGFVAAGAGVLGVDLLRRWAPPLALAAAVASLVGTSRLLDADLWPGVVLNVVLPVLTFVDAHVIDRDTPPRRHAWLHGATSVALLAFVAWTAAGAILWPWTRTWGATPREWSAALPGDQAPRSPSLELLHGVSIAAPPHAVWRWLVQLGQDRAGFYSYDALERLIGDDVHTVREIRNEWQTRHVGDHVYATQDGYLEGVLPERPGWRVSAIERDRTLVLDGWGAFVLLPDGQGGTRFLVRSTISNRRIPVWMAAVNFSVFELPHFIMQRRMMLTIKSLSEQRT